MIILSSSSSLEALLIGSVSSNQLPITVCYNDISTGQNTPYAVDTQTNDTNSVVVVSAPAGGLPVITRQIGFLSIFNADSAAATITIRLRENTIRNLFRTTLAVGDNLIYDNGFFVIDSSGNLKLA